MWVIDIDEVKTQRFVRTEVQKIHFEFRKIICIFRWKIRKPMLM